MLRLEIVFGLRDGKTANLSRFTDFNKQERHEYEKRQARRSTDSENTNIYSCKKNLVNFIQMLLFILKAVCQESNLRKASTTKFLFISAFIPIPSFKLLYKVNEVTVILCLSVSSTQQIIIQDLGLTFHNETVNFCHLRTAHYLSRLWGWKYLQKAI